MARREVCGLPSVVRLSKWKRRMACCGRLFQSLPSSFNMYNEHAKWRIEFARRLSKHITTFDGVKAIVIAGSVARNYADEYSDLEIPVFWEVLPEDTERHALIRLLGADFLYGYNGPSQEDRQSGHPCNRH